MFDYKIKKCNCCNKKLPISQFTTRIVDGRRYWRCACYKCENKKRQGRYSKQITKSRKYLRYYYNKNKGTIKQITRARTKSAIDKKEIKRGLVCNICKKRGKTEAHHADYNNYLDIQWLCRHCHMVLHVPKKGIDALVTGG